MAVERRDVGRWLSDVDTERNNTRGSAGDG